MATVGLQTALRPVSTTHHGRDTTRSTTSNARPSTARLLHSNTHGLRRTAVVTRAAAAAAQVPAPADEGPSLLKNLSLAFDGNCRVTADDADNVTPVSDAFWAGIGVFTAFCILGLLDLYLSPTGVPLMIGSYGTISVLLFGAPDAPVLNMWNILVGHLAAAFIIIMWMKATMLPIWLRRAAGMATMLPMMLLTGSVHPPGGALILTLPDSAKMQALSWWYMLCPGLLGLFVLLPLAKLCTTLKKRYAFTWGPGGFKWLGKVA